MSRKFEFKNKKTPKKNKKRASRKYLQDEIAKRDSTIERFEITDWTKSEYDSGGYNAFFLKLYFEWKYVLRKQEFSMADFKARKDEGEFIEILYIIQEVLGISYMDLPFRFKDTVEQLKEALYDSQQQPNRRKNCYFWSNEFSRFTDGLN